MSDTAKKAREAMKAKAKRLTADPHTKVDSSSWTPPEAENAGVKTGARPLVKRLYKKGGKVVGKSEGKEAHKHAGRMPRKSGGRALTADSLVNRDVREANQEREGTKHVGAFKKGGRAHKFSGGVGANPVSAQNQSMGKAAGMMKKGGRAHHATKGKVNWSQVEEGYRPSEQDPNYVGFAPSKSDQDAISNLARTGSMKGNPTASSDYPDARKRGGKTDGKWIQKAIKHKGALHKALHVPKGENIPEKKLHAAEKKGGKLAKQAHLAETLKGMHRAKGGKAGHPDEAEDKKLIKKMIKPSAMKAHGGDCTCKMCSGGRTMKYAGGGIFSGDSKEKVPGAVGGRKARNIGGRLHREGGGRDVDTSLSIPQATYNFFTGWSNLDKATPDQIAHMNPQDRQMALAAQQPTRAVVPAHRASKPIGSGRGVAGPSAAGMAVGSGRGVAGPTAADIAASQQPSAEQQAGMMGRQPQMSTQYGLFQGGGNRPAMTFSRQVPDANAQPTYHTAPEMTPEQQVLADYNAGRMSDARGGRTQHAKGGRTKGKMNVNIIIGAGHHQQPQGMMGGAPMPNAPVNPQRLPPAMPGGAPMPPQGGAPMPPQGMPPMARKSGGRTSYPIETGSGGGEARLDKIKAYGLKGSRMK